MTMKRQLSEAFFRSSVASVPDYQPGKQPAEIPGLEPFKLSSNEHYLPPLPEVMQALAQPINPAGYPDPAATALICELAAYLEVPQDHLIVGTGASEILTALAQVTLEEGTEVVYPWPSFELYPQAAALNAAVQKPIGLTEDFTHDLSAMAEAITDRTRLVLLCSPNNPTGPTISAAEFDSFMAKVPANVLVALDEAYWEFATDPSAVNGLHALHKYDNLVLVRTFSKAHGLAGLRIGYAVARPSVIAGLRKALVPFGVTQLSQQAALASLGHMEQVMQRAQTIAEARDEFADALRAQGWHVPDAQANFVWLPLKELSSAFEDACVAQSLAVRNLNDGVRISIGPPEAMRRVLDVAGEFRRRYYPTV